MLDDRHILIPDVSMPSMNNSFYQDSHYQSASPLFSYLQGKLNPAHLSHANMVKYVINKQEDVEVHQREIL